MMERLERVENKVDRVEERLSLSRESCSIIRAIVEKTDARTIEMEKVVKVSLSLFLLSFYNIIK